MSKTTLRASELATFEFCQRAWHYARINTPHQGPAQLQLGTAWHDHMVRRSRASALMMQAGSFLIILGFAVVLLEYLLH
jgi:hypothetical protein